MGFWDRLMSSIVAGYKVFREEAVITDLLDLDANFNDYKYRVMRYHLYWAFYENTVYRDKQKWAHLLKREYGLYKYIRGIYNPSYRLGEFWKSHVWGGRLGAFDSKSAIPITTDNDNLQEAIARIWQWSNWEINKGVCALYGAIMGDVGLMVVDDTRREKVRIEVVHPGTIVDVEMDAAGNIKGYTIAEERASPDRPENTVEYKEVVSRDGDTVIYETFLNGSPFDWSEDGESGAVIRIDYGFVPLVLIQHNNVGLDWGFSEFHAGRHKFQEVDDQASKLGDQVRKTVDAKWLFTGVSKPTSSPTATETSLTDTAAVNRPQPGREEEPAIYLGAGADAKPMVAPLDLAGAISHINGLLEDIERDYPELQMDIWTASGENSGRALRTARQRTDTKVKERRPNYDNALMRAHQMAVAIAGDRGYDGFQGFGLDSFGKGDLDHQIGDRTVFAHDPLDESEIEQAFWNAGKAAGEAGYPLELWLEDQGWTEEKIARLLASPERVARMGAIQLALGGGDG